MRVASLLACYTWKNLPTFGKNLRHIGLAAGEFQNSEGPSSREVRPLRALAGWQQRLAAYGAPRLAFPKLGAEQMFGVRRSQKIHHLFILLKIFVYNLFINIYILFTENLQIVYNLFIESLQKIYKFRDFYLQSVYNCLQKINIIW